MDNVLWMVILLLVLIIMILLLKLYLIRLSLKEISTSLNKRIKGENNRLLGVSSRDSKVRELAVVLNEQLSLLRAERQRFQQGDLELKEAVTNISHDLRTPLTVTCGYVELLKGENLPEKAVRYLQIIENRCNVMRQLMEELFRYSIITSAPKEDMEFLAMNDVLEESLAAYYHVFTAKGIVPEIHIPETPVARCLSRAALGRVFENILNNVLKYSDGDLEINMDHTGVITFSNSAAALDSVKAGRLTDRYFTVGNGSHSTGLGLSIAKALTEQMASSRLHTSSM